MATTLPRRIAEVIPADEAGQVKLLVRNNEPIDRLLIDGWVTQEEYLAGQRYAETWHAAGLHPRVGGGYDGRLDGGGAAAPIERQTAAQACAYRAWRHARQSMPAGSRDEVDRVVLWWEEPPRLVPVLIGIRALVRYYSLGYRTLDKSAASRICVG